MADEFSGKYLGRYHLIDQLGKGGMALVYKAFDTTLERFVAVKLILPYQEHSKDFLVRFQREAKALARLSHPNILKIFDYGEFEGHVFLVMEYISGGTLQEWMKTHPVSYRQAARLLACVAWALAAAHAEKIIHRDVKPANILMAGDQEPRLSDFGIAKLIEDSSEATTLTGTGVGIGTPYYMAPEQAGGSADERSDIYALGVIFYEMVTGRLPYEADTPMAVLLKKTTDPLPRPSQYVPGLPPSVENILFKALARQPENRYQTMADFAGALERLEVLPEHLDTLSTEQDLPAEEAPPAPSRRKPLLIALLGLIAAGVLLLCLLGAISGGAFLWRTFVFPPDPPGTLFVATGTALSPATTVPASSIPELPTVVPSATPAFTPTATGGGGEWIAFDSRLGGNDDIYLMDPDGKHRTQLTGGSAHDVYPSWSPDGKQITYQTNPEGDQDIAVLDLATRKVTLLTRNNTCDDWGPSWSPAGDWIVFYSNCDGDRNIYKIRTDGSHRTQLTSTGGTNWFPSWSPDGKKITFTSNRSGKYRIYIMSADGANVRDLAAGCVSYYSPDGSQILYGQYCTDTGFLYLMDANGSNQRTLVEGYECKNATWSPDGTQIVFQLSKTTKEGPFAIYRMLLAKPDRADWILLADYDVNGGSPVWQP
jgi:Tol biopolymer transport system component